MLDVEKTYVGNVPSGFATPLRMLKDVTAQFIPEEAHVRDTAMRSRYGMLSKRERAVIEELLNERGTPLQLPQ